MNDWPANPRKVTPAQRAARQVLAAARARRAQAAEPLTASGKEALEFSAWQLPMMLAISAARSSRARSLGPRAWEPEPGSPREPLGWEPMFVLPPFPAIRPSPVVPPPGALVVMAQTQGTAATETPAELTRRFLRELDGTGSAIGPATGLGDTDHWGVARAAETPAEKFRRVVQEVWAARRAARKAAAGGGTPLDSAEVVLYNANHRNEVAQKAYRKDRWTKTTEIADPSGASRIPSTRR